MAAPPEDGRANRALVDAVAELLGVRSPAVSLVQGRTSRGKRLFVSGIELQEASRRIGEAVDP